MKDSKEQVNITKLAKAFGKIYKGLDKEQVSMIVKEEMNKVIPSENSEVYMTASYDEKDNSIGINIYISNPLAKEDVKEQNFDKIMFEYLLRADIEKLPGVMESIKLMESKGTDNYSIDSIPVSYTKELGDYYFHFRIIKKLKK